MKKRYFKFIVSAAITLILLNLSFFVSPVQAFQPRSQPEAVQGLTPIATLQPDAARQEVMDIGGKQNELKVTADTDGIVLSNSLTGEIKKFPLPEPGGPGRDIFPWVIIPWQVSFSPDGEYMLLLTMEGYPDQGADYFRLWVLNLEGQPEACTHGNGINQAAWINPESIIFFDYDDPSLRNGTVWLWEWKSR